MRHVAVLFPLALSLAVTAPALAQPSASEALLFAAPTGAQLRARLLTHADSIAATDAPEAARALAYRGLSFAREGEPDSAVALYQRAFELDAGRKRRIELAEALLLRLAKGDAERARALLRPIQPITPELPDVGEATVQGSFAWAHYLAGNADSAARLLVPIETWLSTYQEWRYRMACVAFERADWTRVIILLMPLAVASRNLDADVMGLLKESADKLDAGRNLGPQLRYEIVRRDRADAALLAALSARRVSFTGRDGFPLGGVLLAPPTPARPRAAVVLVAPGDTLALYDALAVGLRRMGLAVMLLEPRGSGRSVAASCPLPDSWRGREAQMQARCAGDVPAAVKALAREAKADTAQYLLVGVGATAPIAVEAARLDRRAGVLMLVSPTPSPVDRGPMRATLAALRRPVYFQTGPEDFTTWEVIDSLYRACDQRASRVADTDQYGTHATLFRRDPKILERFRQWLAESWPRPTAPRATPPSRPRKG
jgi:tetratricopeptide (TPR) repeat protein